MKKNNILVICFLASIFLWGCGKDFLETDPGTKLTQNMINSDYSKIWDFGYAPYVYLANGFTNIDGNLSAAITDEAEQTSTGANAQLFNQGTWNAYNNPIDVYSNSYKGIRAASYFLENFNHYNSYLALNRDTISDHQAQYKIDVQNVVWLRAEARVMRAWYYFELAKRYGGVPLVTKVLTITDNTNIDKSSFDEIINYVISEINIATDSLQVNWKTSAFVNYDGRIDKGIALAIKSRALLYAASPLHNASGDVEKWKKAAQATNDVIALNRYSLDPKYQELFVGDYTVKSAESIWAIRIGTTNTMERLNYPIGTVGGNSGVAPSQNLVDAYEYKGVPDPTDPYKNRDPRLAFSIVTNNSSWNGRTIQIWSGGTDGTGKKNTSKTGYYLKKFLTSNLDMVNNASQQRSWTIFRYSDILLNYAEAMNEAYGPDNYNGNVLTARQALNTVRNRTSVGMPDVIAANQAEMRDKIKHERQIELAFEDHRYWDLLRWKDAEVALNAPLMGVSATKLADNTYIYNNFQVETRIFDPSRMYYFPVPQTEIVKSNGVLKQNPNW